MKILRLYIKDFMCYEGAYIDFSEFNSAVIIGKKEEEFKELKHKLNNGRVFIDLVGMLKGESHGGGYEGICW